MSEKLSPNEGIKTRSNFLRGSITEGLDRVITGSLAEDDTQLTKFHGTYQQDDRDLRPERRKKKMEQAYSFMIRVRVPGGVCTPEQWLAMDQIATDYANGTLRLTTRQAFQFHGVIKSNLKRSMQAINASLLDTIAACGDVNRNVMCNPNPHQSKAHAAALDLAKEISDHLTPRTAAYHEIWLNGERIEDSKVEEEPIYGATYLPRKFKIAVAVPPENDVDVYAQDLSFIAIVDAAGSVTGYNVTVGGGMGMTHGEPETYPRTADLLGFCTPEQAVDVAEKVVIVQRDFGDRANRKHARLKYTIEDMGLDAFRAEVEKRLGYKLESPRDVRFEHTGDRYGWVKDHAGKWHCTLFIQNGRIADLGDVKMLSGLREIAEVHKGEFRLTANQNVIISSVGARQKKAIQPLLDKYGLTSPTSGLRRNSMACVALPTCGLALAESERYLPDLVTALEGVLGKAGLVETDIVMRMTGCPNGCARPFLAEIGLVGRAPGKYNLYLGAAFDGSRLNKLYRQDVGHDEIIDALTPLIEAYAKDRVEGERFGDFVVRTGIVAVSGNGAAFHEDVILQ
ncbi:MAG: NADPH-dependent assimilatory sulfite reductase hemoprotein subunit [Alphaproteobacteria bacterium]|nr:NADPH-dependent assimilatory sulfite reductase hemoprotein subunit [Alphaproteobacteria bacterium]